MNQQITNIIEAAEQLAEFCTIEEVKVRCYELISILSSKDMIEFGLVKKPSIKPTDSRSKELAEIIYTSLVGIRKKKDLYILDSYMGYFRSIQGGSK